MSENREDMLSPNQLALRQERLINKLDNLHKNFERVDSSVTALGDRLESWFDEFEKRQEQRWRDHLADRDSWRLRHEAENENMQKDTDREVRNIREKVIRAAGFATAVLMLASTVGGVFLWNLQTGAADVKKDLEAHDKKIDQARDDLFDIKLYLARGGRVPEQPYIPPTQRKDTDEHQQQRSGKP